MALLEISGVAKRFGGVAALTDVSMLVNRGEIIGLIGPNGAGKTTLFNCVSGLIPPDRGRIAFDGTDLARLAPHARAWLGIARTFQLVQT
ncbi:MAG: ATP-binding cassette domain-containing protein, partial [Acidobacteria bacterium]|nr:ATP-binding cassette domain-containing protein [Acidobacteriota bacterium]